MAACYFARVQNTPSYEGITISAFPKYNQEENYQAVAKSLKLIEVISPVSYNRVKKHIDIIFLCDLRKGQSNYYYNHNCFCISIDNIKKTCSPKKAIVQMIAYWLIYSSTSGVFRAKGLDYSNKMVERINKCCDETGRRFMERVKKRMDA
jgi:hypothetical protein